MGEPPKSQTPSPEVLEAHRKRLEELEALGIPTQGLEATLRERPADFEREAAEALRRELQGAPEGQPPAEGEATTVTISGAPAQAEPAPPPLIPASDTVMPRPIEPAGLAPAPEETTLSPPPAEPLPPPPPLGPDEPTPVEPAPPEAFTPAQAPSLEPAPSVIETAEAGAAVVLDDLERELQEALGESQTRVYGSADPSDAPVLAGGDSLWLGAAPAAAASTQAEMTSGNKPPPPRTGAPIMRPQRVVVRPAGVPPGARPAPAGAGAPASEVLPTAEPSRRRFGSAAIAGVVLLVILAGTYFFLINGPPAVSFTFAPGAPSAGEPVIFDANGTTDPNGDPVTFAWEFGDGTNATGPHVTHTYAHSGNYTVNLTATDNHANAARAKRTVPVAAGTVQPPLYRYGDSLGYRVTGTSRVEAAPIDNYLATVNYTLPVYGPLTCGITAVNLTYAGSQSRSVLISPQTVKDGFLDDEQTFVLERSLPDLRLSGNINNTCPKSPIGYTGTSSLLEHDFENLQNNDTVRSETDESTTVTVSETDPPKTLQSSAHLTDYPGLANASSQLHLEQIYAGRAFSTEGVVTGEFDAEGLHWSWLTQGSEVLGGYLAVKIHIVPTNRPPRLSEFTVDLSVSSASSFPLKEVYYVRGIDIGKTYESRFTAAVAGEPTAGAFDIAHGDGSRNYRTLAPNELKPMTQVPRSSAGADFAFKAQTAFDEAVANCSDFALFMADNPQAYSVNGTYSLSAGNPHWALDFAQDNAGERQHIEDEHSSGSGAVQVHCGAGPVGAVRSRAAIGDVVSLNYAADLLKLEDNASALFPAGAFDGAHANFTVRQDLKLPGLSFNAASSAAREAVPFAFGVESFESEPQRVTSYVNAQSGQLVFTLVESGDSLP